MRQQAVGLIAPKLPLAGTSDLHSLGFDIS